MSKERILVVEDDPDFRFILERSLTLNKFEVQSAKNGLNALELLDNFEPKVIIADWMMPQMDGLELCNRIKMEDKYKSIYFILLTARSSLRDRVMGLDVGADDFLVKPVETQELIARIRSGLRIYNLQEELKNAEHHKVVVELACTLGHQINNPLSSLALGVHSLESEIKKNSNEKYLDDFYIINESIQRIGKFVDALKNIESANLVGYTKDLNMLKID